MNATEDLEATLDDLVRRGREHLHKLEGEFFVYLEATKVLAEAQRGRGRHLPPASFEKFLCDLALGNLGRR
jgi:hypothetical protein